MTNKFQLIIDSENLKSGITSNCYIPIDCPKTMTNKIRCEVLLFSVSYPGNEKPDASYIKLTSDNLSIYNQYSKKHILSIYDNLSYRYCRTTFECDSFDGRDIHFILLDESNEPLEDFQNDPYDYPWTLVLQCEEI